MRWRARSIDSATISCYCGVYPVIVDVAVEDLQPTPAIGESNLVVVPVLVAKSRSYHDVRSNTFHPSLEGYNTVLIMEVEHIAAFSTQRWLVSPKIDQISSEPQEV